jgi:hypothetical protein
MTLCEVCTDSWDDNEGVLDSLRTAVQHAESDRDARLAQVAHLRKIAAVAFDPRFRADSPDTGAPGGGK